MTQDPAWKRLARPIYQGLNRLRRPVAFGEMTSSRPIADKMGFARGTPIDRFYIERFVGSHADRIRGLVLEVAEPMYASRFQKDGDTHILHVSDTGADVCADLTEIETLPDSVYDCFIMTQTLNFIFDAQTAARGALRLLKPGGVLITTVSGLSQVSRDDYGQWGDYWRFTDLALGRTLDAAGFETLEMTTFGNALAAQIMLQGLAVEDVPDEALLTDRDEDFQMIVGACARRPV